ncbi:hypothetical protein ACH5A7_21120 [Streptomyces sp. NPDC018955]|uniref:hypothetical protein n=1 Tax=Streptomyces sp. NPDC018955 TaxID=3365055 RepID=UPI0037B22176
MAAMKAPDAPTPNSPDGPLLVEFYDVAQAAVRLGLREPDAPGKTGEKWLRDGFNRPTDGSKGRRFPGRYMAGRLKFSAADLAEIAEIALEESEAKRLAKETAKPRPSTGRPRRLRKTPALATV